MEENNNVSEELHEEPSMMGGLKSIGFALVMFAIAYYFYYTMTNYENGEAVRMNRILLLAYGILGKNITVGILSLIGLVIGYGGVNEIMQSQK